MGQDPLRRIVSVALVAALGVASELVSRPGVGWATLDLAVGLFAAAGGAFVFAAAWFLGTLVGGGSYLVLVYRGPLLQLLLGVARAEARGYRIMVGAAYVAALAPFRFASVATVVVALAGAAVILDAGHRATAASRGASYAAAVSSGALGLAWAFATAGALSDSTAVVLVDAVTMVALAVVIATASGVWARQAERALVVDLGPTRQSGGLPLTRRLARALGDPALDLRYRLPDGAWVNELGRGVPPPPPDAHATRAPGPDGGEVALLHGAAANPPSGLARAAAAAAALSLESARLDAQVRARSHDVDEARRRMLSAADDERRALEERLTEDVLGRLGRVNRLLAGSSFEPERHELRDAVTELVALARGLYPPALARRDLAAALRELGRRFPMPVTIEAADDVEPLSESHRAAAWFLYSEALANVARHSGATSVRIVARRSAGNLELEVADDGRGGARLERGLLGLADRFDALGGRIALSSPDGGPTILRATLPVD